MHVVAKASEPTGTTITMASGQGDVVSVRFARDEHLSDLYEVGDETMVTIRPVGQPASEYPGAIGSRRPMKLSLK